MTERYSHRLQTFNSRFLNRGLKTKSTYQVLHPNQRFAKESPYDEKCK